VFLRNAVQSRRKLYGDEHTDTQKSLLVVANWCRQMGDPEAAIAFLASLMASMKLEHGDPKVLECRTRLGLAYADMGKQKDAREHLQAALELIPETLADNPEYAWLLRKSIAFKYKQLGLIEEGESLEVHLTNAEPTDDLLQDGLRRWVMKFMRIYQGPGTTPLIESHGKPQVDESGGDILVSLVLCRPITFESQSSGPPG
jgi:tetratricopeptide (TPR) repeat protein